MKLNVSALIIAAVIICGCAQKTVKTETAPAAEPEKIAESEKPAEPEKKNKSAFTIMHPGVYMYNDTGRYGKAIAALTNKNEAFEAKGFQYDENGFITWIEGEIERDGKKVKGYIKPENVKIETNNFTGYYANTEWVDEVVPPGMSSIGMKTQLVYYEDHILQGLSYYYKKFDPRIVEFNSFEINFSSNLIINTAIDVFVYKEKDKNGIPLKKRELLIGCGFRCRDNGRDDTGANISVKFGPIRKHPPPTHAVSFKSNSSFYILVDIPDYKYGYYKVAWNSQNLSQELKTNIIYNNESVLYIGNVQYFTNAFKSYLGFYSIMISIKKGERRYEFILKDIEIAEGVYE